MKYCKGFFYFLLVFIFFPGLTIHAQDKARQISFPGKWSMLQDRQGYIWYATADGKVGRYLFSDPEGDKEIFDELPGCNGLNFIKEDSRGNIWIGMGCGLYKFDPATLKFEDVWASVFKQINIRSLWAESWFEDKAGNIWFGGRNLYSYSTKTNRYKIILPDSTVQIRCNIFGGENNSIWFHEMNFDGTFYVQYDPATNKEISRVELDYDSMKLSMEGVVTAGIETKTLTTSDHSVHYTLMGRNLLKFDPQNSSLKKVQPDPAFGDIAYVEIVDGVFFIGTRGGYLLQFDPATDNSKVIWKNNGEEPVDFIFPARYGYRAFATTGNVIYPVSKKESQFHQLHKEVDPLAVGELKSQLTVINGTAYRFLKDGIKTLNPLSGTDSIVTLPDIPATELSYFNVVQARDSSRFWVVYYALNFINKRALKAQLNSSIELRDKAGKLIRKWKDKVLPKFLYANSWTIIEDKKNRLWFCGFDNKLGYLDIQSDSFYIVQNSAQPNSISSFLVSDANTLWFGHINEGLVFYDPVKKIRTVYRQVPEEKNSLSSDKVECLFEASNGVIWIGTAEKGISLLDPATGKFSFLNKKDGLPELSISAIAADKKQNIWVATNHYLCRWIPEEKRFIAYRQQDGFEIDASYIKGVFFPEENGRMYLRLSDGIYAFHSDSLKSYIADIPSVIFTGFLINNKSVGIQAPDSILPVDIDYLKKVKLAYSQNRFTIQYAAIDLYGNVEYAYRLAGFDSEWQFVKNKAEAIYTNVPPGTYTFQVKAINHQGNSSGLRELEIEVKAPWYRTWLAYFIYALLFVALVLGYVRFRSRALIKQNFKLEENVKSRTNELSSSIRELKATQAQLIQSEKMASLGQLTAGIAHEIQNPLNFVNNFSELSNELIDEMKIEAEKNNTKEVLSIADDIKQNLEKISHHGKRADAIVKGMLQHSRTSSGQKQPTDINALISEYLKLAFHGYRIKEKAFEAKLITDFDSTPGMVNIAPQEIGKVLLNLFNNAFFAVAEKSKMLADKNFEPSVYITTKKLSDKLQITIADNGPGIPENIIDKIFQPFFTTKPTGQGTGLGLSLAYDIVTKGHDGQLSVNSRKEGVEFVITLPIS